MVLSEALVKGDQFGVGRLGERRQVGIVPDFGRERPLLGVKAPEHFDPGHLLDVRDTRVALKDVVFLPGLGQCQRVRSEDSRVGCQAQKALLRHSAESARLIG